MKKTIAITGHRPDLLGGYNWNTTKNKKIMAALEDAIEKQIVENDYKRFICGGALGTDQMAFHILTQLKEYKYHDLELIVAVPFKDQPKPWNEKDRLLYYMQLDYADQVVYVDELPEYQLKNASVGVFNIRKYLNRNNYMVDNSDLVIAVLKGENKKSTGTSKCLEYAVRLQKPIIIINPNLIK